jgi:type IV pilus assembly protein PilO
MALPPLDAKQKRNLLFGTLLLLILAYGFYDRVHGPRAARVAGLEQRLETLQAQNSRARGLTRGHTGDVDSTLALYRRQLEAVEALIPSSEELPDLLDAISVEAQRTGVEISLIQPVGATEEQYYTRRVYDMAVLGGYHEIGEFLTRVASLSRIVTPTNLTLAPREGGQPAEADRAPRLEARFSIETYVIPTLPLNDEASVE